MRHSYGHIYKYSDYLDKAAALDKAEKCIKLAEDLKRNIAGPADYEKIGELFLEAGLIHLRYGERKKYLEMFEFSLDHDPEAAFVLAGLSKAIDLDPYLSKRALKIARELDSGIHEDGSMESAIPYFENIVRTSGFIYSGPAKKIAKIIEQMGIKEGNVVDIGTGPAPFAIALSKYVPETIKIAGYDVSKRMLNLAKGILFGLKIGIDLVWGPVIDAKQEKRDNNALPFSPESIDVIISHGSMHHWGGGLEDLLAVEAMFEELLRILKPGGRMLIYDINPSSLGTRFITKSGILKYLKRNYQHEAFYHSARHSLSQEQIQRILNKYRRNIGCKISAASPYFPTGLMFQVVDIRKRPALCI